ncbi:T9SS type A sorting domain-containing protein [Carboxylicivirga taeanensis]|uniref:T9SS type A sorting domain-containing protein n=1 Tax=Carboxylicivirga taeanensis TaxID=1416875 RepID=UPI003F6E2C38
MKLVLIVVAMIATCKVNAADKDVAADLTETGPKSYDALHVIDNGLPSDTVRYVVDGFLFCDNLIVDENTIMVVYGDLTVGTTDLNNVDFMLHGTLVVTGDLNVLGKNSLELNIINTGVLVVGGSYDYEGKNGGAEEDNAGQIYMSDPDDFTGDSSGGLEGDIGDLIESGILPDDIEDSFIDKVDEEKFTTVVWTGGSIQWDAEGNWSNTTIPTTGENVLIESGKSFYPKICNDYAYYMWNLELETGAELFIPAGCKVTVLGDIIIGPGATLTVENSNTKPTSFIVYGQVSGDITFRWTLGALNYWFIGHPISNPSMSVYRNIHNDPDNKCVLYDYTSAGTLVNRVADAGFEFSANEELRGYQVKVLNATTIEQTGIINNKASYAININPNGGWQIIANPYPAYYKLPVDNGDFDATEGTVYVATGTSNADKKYYAFNTSSGIETPINPADKVSGGIIAPGQAFYIKSKADALGSEKIYMKAQHLVHAPTVTLKSSGEKKEENVLRIKLKNESGLTDEAVIALFPNGSFEQTRLDSEQLFYNKTDYSYIFSQENDTKSVIKVLPERIWGHEQKLGIKAKAGRQLLSISGIDNLKESYELVLYDRIANVSTIMDSETVYEFDLREDVEEDRFVLQFNQPQDQIATDVDEIEVNGDVDIFVQTTNYLNVVCNLEAINKIVRVYSLTGSELFNQSFTASRFGTQLNLPSGVYIVKVTSGSAHFEKKIVVK